MIFVAQWRWKRIDPLVEPADKSLSDFFTEVADVIRRYNRLYVCRETPTPRMKVKTFIREVHFDSAVNHFPQIGPVSQVSRASVYLVNNDASGVFLLEELEHLVDYLFSLYDQVPQPASAPSQAASSADAS